MRLQRDASEPGLWTSPGWKAGDGGVFALVVGASRYDHLDGGPGRRASQTFGLGQLSVSALTAFRFFEWLADSYVLEGLPVAQVRLLLSPLRKGDPGIEESELAGCDAAIVSEAPEANFAGCKDAIINWHAAMRSVRDGAAGRSLLFFSGHGLEIRRGRQVLLPSDYLKPPGELHNDAISTFNLLDCLPYLPNISSHVLLLDACRNDVDELRGRKVEGQDLLNSAGVGDTNPQYDQSVVYATTSGLKSYSPRRGGLSLYGQALLDGLSTKPNPSLDEAPLDLRRAGKVRRIEVDKLFIYMKGRVGALIRNAKSQVVQTVRMDKSSSGIPVDLAEIAMEPPAAGPQPTPKEVLFDLRGVAVPADPMVEEVFVDATAAKETGVPHADRARRGLRAKSDWFRQLYPEVVKPARPLPKDADDPQKIQFLHGLFGSEAITFPWFKSLKVRGLSDGAVFDQSAVDILEVRHGARDGELRRIQVHFRLRPRDPAGHLLEITDESGRRVGCVLPADAAPPKYQIEIDVGQGGAGGASFLRFAAFLSTRQAGPLGQAARAWDLTRALSAGEAARQVSRRGFAEEIGRTLRNERASPLAATVVAIILLKAGRFDLMHDWTRNLADRFPELPDGLVLWTEQNRRRGGGGEGRRRRSRASDETSLQWFVEGMSARSLPRTAECFGMAADLALDIQRGRLEVDRETTRGAAHVAERFDAVMPYYRDVGLFSSFAAWPDTFDLARALSVPERVPWAAVKDMATTLGMAADD